MSSIPEALREVEARVAALEREQRLRSELIDEGKVLLETVRRHRLRGRVPMLELAQRQALETVVRALGCVALIAGAWSLDSTLGSVALVLAFAVLSLGAAR